MSDYENDVTIDPDALDEEWINQPNLQYKYGKEEAEAKKEWDRCLESVKVVRSQLIKKCKSDKPKATGLEIEAYYRDHPDHKQAKKDEIEAEYAFNLCATATRSLYQKKSALENLVRLLGMDYFSSPVDPRNIERGASDHRSSRRRTMRKRRK